LAENNKQIFLQKLEIKALKDQVVKMLVELGHLNEEEKYNEDSSQAVSPVKRGAFLPKVESKQNL